MTLPVGTEVKNDVAGLAYTVTDGPVNEAQAIRTYVQAHLGNLLPVPQESSSGRWIWIFIGVNLVILVVGVSVWRYRCR